MVFVVAVELAVVVAKMVVVAVELVVVVVAKMVVVAVRPSKTLWHCHRAALLLEEYLAWV